MAANRLVKFGPAKKQEFIRLLKEGRRRCTSAEAVGVSYETVRMHLHSDPGFRDAVDRAEMRGDEDVEDALRQAAISGNVVACQVWLYNRQPDRWKDKRAVEHSGPGGGPLKMEVAALRQEVLNDQGYLEYRQQQALKEDCLESTSSHESNGHESNGNGHAH